MFTTDRLDAARGAIPSDCFFSNCRILDVFTGKISKTEGFSVHSGYIVGTGSGRDAKTTVDLGGRTVVPGFIDAHIHIESTLLAPREYARLALPRGVVTAIADPHEIANVLGYDGIVWMLKASENLPMNIWLMTPSCVPATDLDTSGAVISARDMVGFLEEPRILGLAEVMNYPGVLAKNPEILEKIALFARARKAIDGHAPGLSGNDLAAYVAAGIGSDHEATTPAEALEKISMGMWIMVREGSGARDLEKLLPAIDSRTSRRMMLCADDRHPAELSGEGYIDRSVRMLIEGGVEPVDAYLMGCRNAAEYFGLGDSGALAPGFKADFIVLDDFRTVAISDVYFGGKRVASGGKSEQDPFEAGKGATHTAQRVVRDSVNIKLLSGEDFLIKAEGKRIKVIVAEPGSIVTGSIVADAKTEGGFCVSDTGRDILKLFVIERHIGSGNIGKGFIRGFGLKRGAIGTTISHDSHNMIIVGVDDVSIFRAAKHLNRMKGGMVVTDGDAVRAELPLPVAGLMSDMDAETVIAALGTFDSAFKDLGVTMPSPLMVLSFMSLPVIPSLKLTDRGLVDVAKFDYTGLFPG